MADSPDDTVAGGDAASQRRSGRVVRPPNKFLQEAAPPAKRKRIGLDGQGLGGEGDDDIELSQGEGDDDADDIDAEEDDDDDDDEAGTRRARPKRKANGASARRAIKKPKLNGAGNHAASLPTRPKKSVRVTIETDGDHDSELYGEFRVQGVKAACSKARPSDLAV